MYRLIDTHAHLDEVENLDSALNKASQAGVIAIVAVGSGYESNQEVLRIAQKHPPRVFPALGLHPWEIGGMTLAEMEKTLEYIERNIDAAVAIGEIGLDYDKRVTRLAPKERQKEVLQRLVELDLKYQRPLIIHSRYAWKDAFSIVNEAGVKKAVFHWYTGFSSVLEEIVREGYFISATPAAEYHEEHRRAIKETPLERLLLETDCPVSYGRDNRYQSEPADIIRALQAVAALKGQEEAMVAEQTSQNAIRFFSLTL